MSTEHPAGELLGELPQKSTRGRPRKPVTQAMIAAHIGTSRRTLARAQAHVEAAEEFPELRTSTLAVDKQIALAKRWRVGRSSPFQAQWLLVEALAREIDALRRKLARCEQRYAEELAALRRLRPDGAEDEEEPRPATPDPDHEAHNRALEAQIRAMDAAGLTKRQIANRLTKAGVPAGTVSGRWDVDSVLAWLVTNRWLGEYRVT